MADSLILSGVKRVLKHTGKDLLLTRPKRGGDTHKIKEWWHGGTGSQYVDCTIFDVTANGQKAKLAVASNGGTSLRIIHDGQLNFEFFGASNVSRAALFTQELTLIEHYVLPAVSKGKVMTVKPQGTEDKPSFEVQAPVKPLAPKPVKKAQKKVIKTVVTAED
jgi:hypothetical protein